ncbi:MAG: hypothetical protein ACTSWQ_00780 [Candidatus Thorarchaeota archaeon]
MTDYEIGMIEVLTRMAAAWEKLGEKTPPPQSSAEELEVQELTLKMQKVQAQRELQRIEELEADPEIEELEKTLQKAYKKRDVEMLRQEGFID